MDRATLAAKARQHWEEWLPNKTAELKLDGAWMEASEAAAQQALDLIAQLVTQGYRAHEAEEVALKQYILLTPEPPPEDDWQEIELAEKERAYQDMMQEPAAP